MNEMNKHPKKEKKKKEKIFTKKKKRAVYQETKLYRPITAKMTKKDFLTSHRYKRTLIVHLKFN